MKAPSLSSGKRPLAFISRTAQCEAAQPSSVTVCGVAWPLTVLAKNALTATTSRLSLKWKSIFVPSRPIAQYRRRHYPRILMYVSAS